MKLILILILTSFSLIATAQSRNNQVSKHIDDDGKTMKVILKVTNDSTSVKFKKSFEVQGMNQRQKDELINHVVDSLGLKKYFKSASSTATSSARSSAKSLHKESLVVATVVNCVDFTSRKKLMA